MLYTFTGNDLEFFQEWYRCQKNVHVGIELSRDLFLTT